MDAIANGNMLGDVRKKVRQAFTGARVTVSLERQVKRLPPIYPPQPLGGQASNKNTAPAEEFKKSDAPKVPAKGTVKISQPSSKTTLNKSPTLSQKPSVADT